MLLVWPQRRVGSVAEVPVATGHASAGPPVHPPTVKPGATIATRSHTSGFPEDIGSKVVTPARPWHREFANATWDALIFSESGNRPRGWRVYFTLAAI